MILIQFTTTLLPSPITRQQQKKQHFPVSLCVTIHIAFQLHEKDGQCAIRLWFFQAAASREMRCYCCQPASYSPQEKTTDDAQMKCLSRNRGNNSSSHSISTPMLPLSFSVFLCLRASGPLYLQFYPSIHEQTGNWIILALCACVGVSFCMVVPVSGGGGGYFQAENSKCSHIIFFLAGPKPLKKQMISYSYPFLISINVILSYLPLTFNHFQFVVSCLTFLSFLFFLQGYSLTVTCCVIELYSAFYCCMVVCDSVVKPSVKLF